VLFGAENEAKRLKARRFRRFLFDIHLFLQFVTNHPLAASTPAPDLLAGDRGSRFW
jgi:hypothetical protein